MKKSMQVIAMAAFLGCFAVLAIAAGSERAKAQEECGEEWQKTDVQAGEKTDEKYKEQASNEISSQWTEYMDELTFPIHFFQRLI